MYYYNCYIDLIIHDAAIFIMRNKLISFTSQPRIEL